MTWRREEADRDFRLLVVVGGSRGGNMATSGRMQLGGCAGGGRKGRFSFTEVKVWMFSLVEGWSKKKFVYQYLVCHLSLMHS